MVATSFWSFSSRVFSACSWVDELLQARTEFGLDSLLDDLGLRRLLEQPRIVHDADLDLGGIAGNGERRRGAAEPRTNFRNETCT